CRSLRLLCPFVTMFVSGRGGDPSEWTTSSDLEPSPSKQKKRVIQSHGIGSAHLWALCAHYGIE
ncbi:hypothetical protein AVEN_145231-1, partial [Araneus ventricosus]